MLSKELFINTLDTIQKEQEKYDRFSNAVREICAGYPIVLLGDGYLNALLSVLDAYFEDENETISWWLFENVEKKIWETNQTTGEDIEHDVSTPEALYDYLVRNAENK